jgi:hypothetical protein
MKEIPKEWLAVMERLGRENTIRLIENGTSLAVVEKMIEVKDKLKIDL